jgi:hypothetical protein
VKLLRAILKRTLVVVKVKEEEFGGKSPQDQNTLEVKAGKDPSPWGGNSKRVSFGLSADAVVSLPRQYYTKLAASSLESRMTELTRSGTKYVCYEASPIFT